MTSIKEWTKPIQRNPTRWYRTFRLSVFGILIGLGLIFVSPGTFAEIPLCSGPNNLLSLSDRPSVASSSCTVGTKSIVVESGFERDKTLQNTEHRIYPNSDLRYGLSEMSELDILPSAYNRYQKPTDSGFGITTIGYRRIAYHDTNQIVTFLGFIRLPSGSRIWGSRKGGFQLKGIYTHSLPSGFGFTTIADVSLFSDPPISGGKSYYSFNPIGLISWSPIDPIQIYWEVYSQSKTDSESGWGVNGDIGLMILLSKNLMVDLNYGHRIAGALSDLHHYVGCGLVVRLA
ncbi:transporter [Legionella sp. W05-934-2]|jgi:hypothetical protein|uniref:transporter n=1 Tax=Legionella sp. W05-934-2 TaxID=1198649 RepID=UPI003462E20B